MVHAVERLRPPGRNDPCPCGSGKKYKRCCLIHEAPRSASRGLATILADVLAAEEMGDSDGALQTLEDARTVLFDRDLHSMLVERYLEMPPEDAETALRRWWNEDHDRFSGGGLAMALIDQGRKEEALTVLSESQGTEAWPEYWRLLAMLHDEEGKTAAAVTAMELYSRLVPENAEAWMLLAEMQQRVGQIDRALASLRRAGDALPSRIAPRLQRVRILADASRWTEVRGLSEPLLEQTFDDVTDDILFSLQDLLAQAYFVLGDFDGARTVWSALLAVRPDDDETRYRLANLERLCGRHRRALLLLEVYVSRSVEMRVLDIQLHSELALGEFDDAVHVAMQIEEMDHMAHVLRMVRAAEAVAAHDYAWAMEQLVGDPPDRYRDLWYNLQLDCLARLGLWDRLLATLKLVRQPDEAVVTHAALGAMSVGKLDLAQRLLTEIEDQGCMEVRALSGLLGPLRQSRRAAEVRRQQQVDAAEKQRWAAESRELRRRLRDLEHQNAAMADALARSEAGMERMLEIAGVSIADEMPADWEAQLISIAEHAHKTALQQELVGAEARLRSMLGQHCWNNLSEGARVALREGEWLYVAVQGEDRDNGASLLEFARGLERAFKDAIFSPIRAAWERQPGPLSHLQTEGLDPSLGPFVRYVLQGGHLTLGSMAAALDRMADERRQGVAIRLLRRQLGLDIWDERTLGDWRRTAERLLQAADARNRPAHASAVSRESVRYFRELVLGTDGLLRALP